MQNITDQIKIYKSVEKNKNSEKEHTNSIKKNLQ